ncbi:DUF6296 family protein [Kitasatospora sp. NPDC059673]|uniref:DUF6296 family protein n=1 Tax=Kitasatospora sp. NPDC059673 TaxID=3346901 RepID=UPI003695CBDD
MDPTRRYAVTLPGAVGRHAPPTVVIVHSTDAVGPDGRLVWESSAGDLRVEIDGDVAIVLPAPGRDVRPLPARRAPAVGISPSSAVSGSRPRSCSSRSEARAAAR